MVDHMTKSPTEKSAIFFAKIIFETIKIVPYILYSEILLRISKFCSPHFQSSFAHLVVEGRIHLLPNLSDLCLYSS